MFKHSYLLLGKHFGSSGREPAGDAVIPITFRAIVAGIRRMANLNEMGETDAFQERIMRMVRVFSWAVVFLRHLPGKIFADA